MRPPGRDLPEQPPARRGLGGHARRHVPAIELAVGKQRAAPRARSDGVEERRQSTIAMAMAHGKRPPARPRAPRVAPLSPGCPRSAYEPPSGKPEQSYRPLDGGLRFAAADAGLDGRASRRAAVALAGRVPATASSNAAVPTARRAYTAGRARRATDRELPRDGARVQVQHGSPLVRESVSQSVAIIESSAGAESAEHGLARENARARATASNARTRTCRLTSSVARLSCSG